MLIFIGVLWQVDDAQEMMNPESSGTEQVQTVSVSGCCYISDCQPQH